ncbi:hypothetical protein [Acidiphilium acidophilum]|uniref:Uncharacterized protein n=1 Tax=Acidiphilium acidophilum TaxID=76588 RepID=A0AAW9DSM7_ACIAO|nr:hypothetical protein [Acidiphilium acidophilum]MDX5932020.1 hypothetical protein [Acidiphilium acidophilum]GBQ25457.1 hypothetical protein AA700_1553 [Acidiphilium acidophilum DSM 700]
MSSSVTVVGGVNNTTISGTVSVPVSGLSTSALTSLQSSLSALSLSVVGGTEGLTNSDLANGSVYGSTVSGTGNLLVLSNTDSVGATTAGSVSNVVGVSSIYSSVVVQAPGALTLNGSGATNANYLLGASSNVDLFTGTGKNSVVAAGGTDTINMLGNTAVTVSAGEDTVKTYAGSNTVVATGSASVYAGTPTGYAGSVDFINGSVAGSMNAGAGKATVFGGNGGGTFIGGTSGSNSLVGGNGSVFLVGGGNNDTLVAGGGGATSSSGANYLFAGSGNETLMATSVTGTNLFAAGSGTDVMMGSGKDTQYFFGSTGSATMTGSTMTGSSNIFFFGTSGNSGGNDVITNFGKTSQLFAVDGTNIAAITQVTTSGSPGALVTLSDGTHITLTGVSAASIQGSIGTSSIA